MQKPKMAKKCKQVKSLKTGLVYLYDIIGLPHKDLSQPF